MTATTTTGMTATAATTLTVRHQIPVDSAFVALRDAVHRQRYADASYFARELVLSGVRRSLWHALLVIAVEDASEGNPHAVIALMSARVQRLLAASPFTPQSPTFAADVAAFEGVVAFLCRHGCTTSLRALMATAAATVATAPLPYDRRRALETTLVQCVAAGDTAAAASTLARVLHVSRDGAMPSAAVWTTLDTLVRSRGAERSLLVVHHNALRAAYAAVGPSPAAAVFMYAALAALTQPTAWGCASDGTLNVTLVAEGGIETSDRTSALALYAADAAPTVTAADIAAAHVRETERLAASPPSYVAVVADAVAALQWPAPASTAASAPPLGEPQRLLSHLTAETKRKQHFSLQAAHRFAVLSAARAATLEDRPLHMPVLAAENAATTSRQPKEKRVAKAPRIELLGDASAAVAVQAPPRILEASEIFFHRVWTRRPHATPTVDGPTPFCALYFDDEQSNAYVAAVVDGPYTPTTTTPETVVSPPELAALSQQIKVLLADAHLVPHRWSRFLPLVRGGGVDAATIGSYFLYEDPYERMTRGTTDADGVFADAAQSASGATFPCVPLFRNQGVAALLDGSGGFDATRTHDEADASARRARENTRTAWLSFFATVLYRRIFNVADRAPPCSVRGVQVAAAASAEDGGDATASPAPPTYDLADADLAFNPATRIVHSLREPNFSGSFVDCWSSWAPPPSNVVERARVAQMLDELAAPLTEKMQRWERVLREAPLPPQATLLPMSSFADCCARFANARDRRVVFGVDLAPPKQ